MLTFTTARILVISRTEEDLTYMEDFFQHLDIMKTPVFEVNRFVPADKYDFIIFDAHSLPSASSMEAFVKLPDDIQAHYFLLDRYLRDTTKYVVFFGKYYHNLNQERCPSANSKFTLFARIRELIDFINHYKAYS